MPDLSKSVQVVKNAVDNLVDVGNETCSTSTDDHLRAEMSHAVERVNYASKLLIDAAQILKNEPSSVRGRKMLIEGARCKNEIQLVVIQHSSLQYLGILQGISALLLTFDESEVRKIVTVCQHVLNHLSYAETLETIDALVDFVKVIENYLHLND